MISPSATSPEDQVKREFGVTNKLNPILCPIYPSSSSNPAFSDPAPTPTSAGGSPNFSNESPAPVTYEFGGQCLNYEQADEFINYHNDEEEYNEEDYFNSFPPGYRFKPHDEELVVYYLKRKIYNQSLPRNRIKEVELYKYNPDTLAAKYNPNGEDEWYFFTPRNRKYPNGDRPNRAAGDGFWKATGADKQIRFNVTTVGLKKSLVFYRGKPPRGDKTDWIMHEYKLMDAPKRKKLSQNDMKLDDCVLCKIRKKDKKDKSVKHTISELQSQSSDASPPPEKNLQKMPAVITSIPTPTPIITGRNEDFNFGYSHNYNGYSESF
ncbi:NAC domain containing protein 32 [Euphorbia peplus]|nr:NAC domain containing protein 32 [Euphorbia peplus]